MNNQRFGRRQFLGGAVAAPAILAQRNPNDRIGVAVVGVGTRGAYLHEQVQESTNTEVRMICDLYDGNIQRALKACRNPKVQTSKDWEKAISSPDIDAVLIATPDFWHAPMTIRAAQLKKHVYCEKGMCRTLKEAKDMRKAVKDNGVAFQLGHHENSDPTFHKAREIYRSGQLGKMPLVRTYIDRTNPWPEWQFYTRYDNQVLPPDANQTSIDWERFQRNSAVKTKFDAERFFRWRCWWEYGTGIAGDLMSHQWDSINMVVGMGIPEAMQTQGALYFWTEDRDVPDQWHALMEYPKQKLTVTFACTFHNRHHGTCTYLFGRDASLEVASGFCRVYGAEWKPEYAEKAARARREAVAQGRDPRDLIIPPDYSYKPGEIKVTSHMQNFIDAIRGVDRARCDIDRGFQEAVTIAMAVESYRKERKIRWDTAKEEFV